MFEQKKELHLPDLTLRNGFDEAMLHLKRSNPDLKLTPQDKQVLKGLEHAQHAYVAEMDQLSLFDLSQAYQNGVLGGATLFIAGQIQINY